MDTQSQLKKAHASHPRKFTNNTYVYPVVSRRSGGISLGINLNPDKNCNFDCPYCQVDRTVSGPSQKIDIPKILAELGEMLTHFDDQGACLLPEFDSIPPEKKVLKDIALSGDGEPTMAPEFEHLCEELFQFQQGLTLRPQLVLITNATLLGKPSVLRGIGSLLKNNGAVWAKLDAGTEAWYQKVNVTGVQFEKILDNLLAAGKKFPLTLQTLFFKIRGEGPSAAEIEKYIERIKHLVDAGASISEIQLHTLARPPAQNFCEPLPEKELRAIQQKVARAAGVAIQVYL